MYMVQFNLQARIKRIKCEKAGGNYIPTYLFMDTPYGSYKNGFRCENLENLTFKNNSIDLVITEDVFEHILNPGKAFREVARILKPKGMHIFSIPWYPSNEKTIVRVIEENGKNIHLMDTMFHGSCLVTREWGQDFINFIYNS